MSPRIRGKRGLYIKALPDPPDGYRWCTPCSALKSVEDFSPKGIRCRSCEKAKRDRFWSTRDPDERRRKQRSYDLTRKYGIASEEYEEMYSAQNGQCAICGTHADESIRGLFVDHDHSSGKVRGLLCIRCNGLLGYCDDTETVLIKAIEYLQKDY